MPWRRLKEDEVVDTHSLIKAIERKDRRFRLFQTIFMVGTFVALIVIISAQQRTLDNLHLQIDEARKVAQDTRDQNDDSLKTIIRRLDCMAVFFNQRDRTNLTIQNIDQCTLNREGDLQEFFVPNGDGGTVTPNRQDAPETPAPQPSAQSPPAARPPESAPAPTATPEPPLAVEPRPPTVSLPLVNLPVCLPFDLLCVE